MRMFILLLLVGCTSGLQQPAPAPTIVAAVDVVVPAVVLDRAPPDAQKYRAALLRETRVSWGLDGPVALFGAQVEQESGWNPNAHSGAGAQGLGQFMPATARDMGALGLDNGIQPYNPDWSLRALTKYNRQLYERATAATECDRHAFMLVAYNGGEGWRKRDQTLAAQKGYDPQRYFGNVELINAGRAASMWAENRGYVPAILKRQPHYVVWGKGTCL